MRDEEGEIGTRGSCRQCEELCAVGGFNEGGGGAGEGDGAVRECPGSGNLSGAPARDSGAIEDDGAIGCVI
jgi:hypothetical protein